MSASSKGSCTSCLHQKKVPPIHVCISQGSFITYLHQNSRLAVVALSEQQLHHCSNADSVRLSVWMLSVFLLSASNPGLMQDYCWITVLFDLDFADRTELVISFVSYLSPDLQALLSGFRVDPESSPAHGKGAVSLDLSSSSPGKRSFSKHLWCEQLRLEPEKISEVLPQVVLLADWLYSPPT